MGNGVAHLIRTVREVVIDKAAFEQRSEGGRAIEKSGRKEFQVGEGASVEALRWGRVPGMFE